MKKIILVVAVVAALAVAGLVQAGIPPWFEYIIGYDGYVERHLSPTGVPMFTADTLFVITNTDPTDMMNVWVEVFDKYGKLVWEGEVWDGGQQVPQIVPNGYGWFTLGMILNMVGRDTHDPFGNPGAEKFYVRISAGHLASQLNLVPIVEVKQVIFYNELEMPGYFVWQPWVIKTWSEAVLGGSKNTTGVIWPK